MPGAAVRRSIVVLLAVAHLAAAAEASGRATVREILGALERDYAIRIEYERPNLPVRTAHGAIEGRRAERGALRAYALLLAEEFRIYPPEFVRRVGLRRLVLCSRLTFAGQARAAVPDFAGATLYLDVERGAHSRMYQRKVIHHEFFHIVDWRDDGKLYEDAAWSALNPASFRYGDGGRAAQHDPRTSLLTDEFPGFLNHYSTTGVEEDKAEVFAHLMVEPDIVRERARRDPVVARKAQRMRELLEAFCSSMDAGFWERVDARPRLQQPSEATAGAAGPPVPVP